MFKRPLVLVIGLIFIGVVVSASLLFLRDSTPSNTRVAQDTFVAGKDYIVIESPVRTVDPNKIEVTEVFWYGCGHCYQFLPLFDKWMENLPSDVLIEYSPAMWNSKMEVHAKIFYIAKTLGVLEAMHKEIFDAMNLQGKALLKEDEIFPLFAQHGISREAFDNAFKSFSVRSLVQQANARARGYGITGTPEIIVNGKYRTSASLTGSHEKMLKVAEFLINKERKATGA